VGPLFGGLAVTGGFPGRSNSFSCRRVLMLVPPEGLRPTLGRLPLPYLKPLLGPGIADTFLKSVLVSPKVY